MKQYIPLGDLLESSDSGVWGDEDLDAGVSVLRSTNFNPDGTLDLTKLTFRALDARDQSRKLLRAGDILLEKSGGGPKQPVGRVCLFLGDAAPHAFGNFIARLRPARRVLSEYLFYYLWQFHSSGKTSHYQKQTTGIRNLEFRRYLTIPVPVCAIEEQRRIVDQLSRAESIVRLRGQAQQKAAALIPAMFVDTFGDPVTNPKGWPVKALADLCLGVFDIDHKMPKAVDAGIPFISAKDLLDEGTICFDDVKKISLEDFHRLSRKGRPKRNDIIYSRIGARLGKARLVEVDFDFLASYSCCTIRPNHEIVNATFLHRMLDSPSMLRQAQKGIRSIGVPDLGLGEIKSFRVIAPPLALQAEFAARATDVVSVLSQQIVASERAKAVFNALLARAFSIEGTPAEVQEAHKVVS